MVRSGIPKITKIRHLAMPAGFRIVGDSAEYRDRIDYLVKSGVPLRLLRAQDRLRTTHEVCD